MQGTLIRKQPLFPAGQKHLIEFKPLCGVEGHKADSVAFGYFVVLHDQRYVVQEAGQRLEIGHRANQFLKIFQPPRRLGRLVPLPHVCVTALVKHGGDGYHVTLPHQ
jgi:hypothetical protein